MKKYEVKMTMLVAVSVEVEAENEEQAEKRAMEQTAREEAYYLRHYDSIWERDITEVNETKEGPLADYSEDYRKGIAYVMENLDEDDKAIIHAECNKAYKQHLVPSENVVDDSPIIDLLEEYGQDNDLPEGWYLDEYDASEILTMV